MSKVTEAESKKIKEIYEKYRKQGLSKQIAYIKTSEETGRGRSTIFDHINQSSIYSITQSSSVSEVRPDSARIISWDIETAPNLGWCWGKYDQTINNYEQEWYMLSWSAKVYGSDEVITRCLADYKGYKPMSQDDSNLVKELHALLSTADITVAHNGEKFDIRRANTRFLLNGLPPPRPYRSIDTLKVAKKYFSFNSNRLDDLGQVMGLGRKVKHDGFDLWKGCMMGDAKSWEQMKAYNAQDVLLLEKIYTQMRSWITNHPNVSLMSNMAEACSVCTSRNLIRRGFHYTTTGRSPRFQCKDCKHYGTGKWERMTYIR
jgi:hypothetical protein